MRYLTKSRFKLALECVTKLYYTKKEEYSDESIDDPFLIELARSGFQVGELAKFLFSDNPVSEQITIDTLDHDTSIKETQSKLNGGQRVVIAEAAFCYKSLFVRTDIVVKKQKRIELYEVKAKSFDGHKIDFITKKGVAAVSSEWASYLYDIAFQKYVASKALEGQGFEISAHLILVDRGKTTTIEGLNQKFKIFESNNSRPRVEIENGLTASKLGDPIVTVIKVDDVVRRILDEFPVPTDYELNMSFDAFVNLCVDAYTNDKRIFAPIGKKCKACQFINSNPQTNPKKSGFLECWKNKTNYNSDLLNNFVLDLWCGMTGSRSLIDELIGKDKYRLETVDERDIAPKKEQKDSIGLTPHGRRMEQITRVKTKNEQSYLDLEGLNKEMARWVYPLHMIDFETTMTALPFHSGRHPYEGIAFQFSHHTIDEKGHIVHSGQYLSFQVGVFPNYEFVRELKTQLEKDKGSVFRYHNHENTFLNLIYRQLESDSNPPKDKPELQSFIRRITSWKEDYGGKEIKKQGERSMIDLYKLVLDYYYPPFAKGNNSIKKILPAIIDDSKYLREKYSKPVYGRGKEVTSLNFDEHVWIDNKFGNDPYKTLPRLFEGYDSEQLDRLVYGVDSVDDGGAAMMAYRRLQFSEVPKDQREELRDGLLRYCELDTMAMVMIIEGWQHFGN